MLNRILTILFVLFTWVHQSNAQFSGPNAIAWNPNNFRYYITNSYGKNVVSLDGLGNKSVFISGLTSPNNIIYADLPALSGFLILDSNIVKAYDDAGAFYASYSTTGAIRLQDIVYDTSLQALFISDVDRGVIYKTTFGGPPFYLPSTAIFASPHRRPSAMLLQAKMNRLLYVEDTTGGNLMAVDLKTGNISKLKSLGIDSLVGLAEDGQGNLYLSSRGTKAIYQLNKYYYGNPVKLYNVPRPADLFVNPDKDQWAYTCMSCGTVYTPPLHLFGPGFEIAGCKGDSVVSYKHYLHKNIGTFDDGNQFYLELSNLSGSFSKPYRLATISDTLIPDSFNAEIPANLSAGTYRMRWRSSLPPVIGSNDLFTIYQNPLAYIAVSDTVQGCKNSELILGRANLSGKTFSWEPAGEVDNPGIPEVKHQVNKALWLHLSVTDDNGCVATDSAFISPVDNPDPGLNTDTLFSCFGDTATLGNSAVGGITYLWSPSDELNDSSSARPKYSGSANKMFILMSTASGGCSSLDTQYVVKMPLPTFSLVLDSAIICQNKSLINSIIPGTTNYQAYWVDPFNDTTWGDSKSFIWKTGKTLVYFKDLNTGCKAQREFIFDVYPATAVGLTEQNYILQPSTFLTSRKWYFNDTLIAVDSLSYPVIKTGWYKLCGMDSNGCEVCTVNKTFNANSNHKFKANDCEIYPNPAVSTLFIRSPNEGIPNWQIKDVTGKEILQGFGNSIDISGIHVGMYYLHLSNNQTIKFVKHLQ